MTSAPDFTPVAVLKRDHFSTIVQGHAPGHPAERRVPRDLNGRRWRTAGIARRPRHPRGTPRAALLALLAQTRIAEAPAAAPDDPALPAPIAGRLNLSDRRRR